MQKTIIVEMSTFKMQVFEFGEVVRTIRNLSVGLQSHRTPIFDGSLHLTKRRKNHVSNAWPKPNGGAPMPYSLFFREHPSCAFHEGSAAVPSHGCIHLEPPDAQWLFEWAGSSPVGLSIRGPYPASSVPPPRFYFFGAPNMRDQVIRAIQQALLDRGFDPKGVDGFFGDDTDEAVRAFQTANPPLVVDGKVGQETANLLGVQLVVP